MPRLLLTSGGYADCLYRRPVWFSRRARCVSRGALRVGAVGGAIEAEPVRARVHARSCAQRTH
jgi:hypothetical protein